MVFSPPMKGQESQDALGDPIKRGDVDTVATDHCPFVGVKNMYPYILSKANDGVITFPRAVQIRASNSARTFGCTDKDSPAVGKDADIIIYDPTRNFTVH